MYRGLKKMKNKKSQGSVLTTVLLVVVGIVAVALVSVFIINMIRENTALDNARVELSLNPAMTFYAVAETSTGSGADPAGAFISVTAGSRNINLKGLTIVLGYPDGSFLRCMDFTAPGELETRIYGYITSPTNQKPFSVEIAPIVEINGKEKLLPVASSMDLKEVSNGQIFESFSPLCCSYGSEYAACSNPR
jgi:hypothetical protein